MTQDERKASSDEAEVEGKREGLIPPIDFNTFVLSMNTSALLSMGDVRDPQLGEVEVNLDMASQTVDILAMLEEKTQGNLTGEEERLLAGVLHDLRGRLQKKRRAP